ncbi:YpoC family protein [Bacillus spongiae]|uniref:YpoC family protein n=1 Tax=Bacillus spongiae TaxID=2683610 RepID=A0ABU8HDF3_9BACI
MDIIIPNELVHPVFYSQNTHVFLREEDLSHLASPHYFYYELVYYSGEKYEDSFPWQDPKPYLKEMVDDWSTLQETISNQIKQGEKVLDNHMKKGISFLFMLVFWSNKTPVILDNWQKHMESLEIKAFNLCERVEFILLRPTSYHSFIQLGELIKEQYKHAVKHFVIEKR